jgi:hypothetical protein
MLGLGLKDSKTKIFAQILPPLNFSAGGIARSILDVFCGVALQANLEPAQQSGRHDPKVSSKKQAKSAQTELRVEDLEGGDEVGYCTGHECQNP